MSHRSEIELVADCHDAVNLIIFLAFHSMTSSIFSVNLGFLLEFFFKFFFHKRLFVFCWRGVLLADLFHFFLFVVFHAKSGATNNHRNVLSDVNNQIFLVVIRSTIKKNQIFVCVEKIVFKFCQLEGSKAIEES